MIRRLPIYILLLTLLATAFGACSSKDNEEDNPTQEITLTNVAVNSFSLAKNDSVLARLDSVFFSIDLNSALIFNADSLPKGTNVSRLILNIGLPSVSEATIIEPAGSDGKEITHDYLKNSKDSIDFSRGDVKLHLVSYDKSVSRDYTIKVNVHNMVSDSLYWNSLAMTTLPGGLAAPKAQKTVRFKNQAYCLVYDGEKAVVSTCANPYYNDWASSSAELPANPDINSFTAAGDNLYILDSDGNLYQSTDGCAWESCGVKMHWLYGDYNGMLIGSSKNDNNWSIVTYPGGESMAMPQGFPVEGTSNVLSFENEWASLPMAMMIGGKDSEGNVSGDTWGFDGINWSTLNVTPFPALDNMTLLPYFSFITNKKNWKVTRYTTLVAMCGRDESGRMSTTVYISLDNGVHWKVADQLMQLPSYMPAMSSCSGLVFPTTMESRSANGWTEFAPLRLPPWYMVSTGAMSRAIAPIDEWECPFIYLFGGIVDNGDLCNTIWRGVINRLTFKPLQ